ncbi:four-carbon acid sugar kinase family protein [Parapedobacter sp. 2B3]|uniref:four-carbon acid sugar kinase family protein n=1 Tax=Parapedobacter sp. 2B3 TaxID=3342381 RepID=UPI0035B5F53E
MDSEMLLTYYGDDFTGSADVLEALALNGVPAALFLKVPTAQELSAFRLKNEVFDGDRTLAAFGVAGVSRTMNPVQMRKKLPDIFARISRIPTRFFHYKICSTFDSSPGIGSIGYATEIALQAFPASWVPLLVGAPDLNRFCLFGNLFARADGVTYRLDRHPTMSKHPVTPMNESDLRLHLGQQTDREVKLVDVFALEAPVDEREKLVAKTSNQGDPPIVLFDVLHEKHLHEIGGLIERFSKPQQQLIVGSSGVEHALSAFFERAGKKKLQANNLSAGKANRIIVVTGSCSPMTKKQIEWSVANGFSSLRMDAKRLMNPQTRDEEYVVIISKAMKLLQKSRKLILFSALGPDDPSITETKAVLAQLNGTEPVTLGVLQGRILKSLLKKYSKSRVVISGGDTAGQVASELDIYALEFLVPIAPGSPLCLAHSKNPVYDGIEIAFKGGQNGNERYFDYVYKGGIDDSQGK